MTEYTKVKISAKAKRLIKRSYAYENNFHGEMGSLSAYLYTLGLPDNYAVAYMPGDGLILANEDTDQVFLLEPVISQFERGVEFKDIEWSGI